jgi:dTDP-4-dehydrorhamnose 3,5-epimerase
MLKKPLFIKGVKHKDKRGHFQEIFLKKKYNINIIFTAIAFSKKNVIRGLHYQTPNKQTKFIHVVKGKILDVVVNLDKKSKNFGKIYKFILVDGDTLIVPNNYAHGYECLSNNSIVLYHLDNYRDVNSEKGIYFKDRSLNIKWFTKKPIVSIRDKMNKSFNDLVEKNS